MLLTRLRQKARATAYRAGIAGAGLLFILGAAVFFLLALHTAVSDVLGPITSALSIGAALLIVGLLLLLAASRGGSGEGAPATGSSSVLGGGNPVVSSDAGQPPVLRDPRIQAAGMGLLAGLLIGKGRRRRR